MKLPITTIILTYNEEKNIADCLKSVYDWSDEIIVVDSGSTDGTLDIVKKYTNKIYSHPFENYAKQRNWSQINTDIKNEWVLHLDSDERVDQDLVEELKRIFSGQFHADGFLASRKTIFRGKWMLHGGHYPIYHLRLFKKSKGSCEDRAYDQYFIVKGHTLKIKGDIINIMEPDLRLLKKQLKRWVDSKAEEALDTKKRIANLNFSGDPVKRRRWLKEDVYYKSPLFARVLVYFIYRYILRGGFLDGWAGLIFHFWQGFWFMWLVDLEIYRRKSQGAKKS